MIFADVMGYVLAGGESSRMQRSDLPADKAMLVLGGKTLLERALGTLAEVCPNPRILCGTQQRCGRLQHLGPTVLDRVHHSGPLGGLHAALIDARSQGAAWVLLTPVDLPWMSSAALAAFVDAAVACGAAASCMRAEGLVQPLPLLVHVDAESLVALALQSGERKLLRALRDVSNRAGKLPGLCAVDVENFSIEAEERTNWFRNVNTPEDYAAAQQNETLGSAAHQSKHGG